MQKEEIKFLDSTVFEGMTSIRAILRGKDSKVNTRPIHKILYDKERYAKNAKNIAYLKAVSEKYAFQVEESTADELDKLTLGTSHGGIIAIAGERETPIFSKAADLEEKGFYAIIQGIEDPYNFGYALRSLYACGVDGIILPKRNWMSAAGVVCRSSAGASEMFKLYVSENVEETIDIFKAKGYSVVCADERTDNILGETSLPLPILLIVGGEKRGISRSVLEKADKLVKISYGRPFAASLSAASATTMFAYEIMRQNQNK
jgi:23S rRNA (guanosine2251-2'-O)-methyltransferase